MKKMKRIFAIFGIVLLLAMYGSTLIFALSDHPDALGWLMASLGSTVIIPVFLYAYIMVYKYMKDRNKKDE